MSVDPNRISRPVSGRSTASASEALNRRTGSSSLTSSVLNWVRAGVRIGLILMWTGGMFAIWAPVSLALFYCDRLRIEWRQLMFSTWCYGFLKVIGGHIEVNGSPPDDPFFLVANHLSYIDIPVLGSQLDTSFVAKQEIRSWPVLGFLTNLMGTTYIDRDDCFDIPRVNHRIADRIESGDGVVVFPEGTSTSGKRVKPFNSPLLEYPAKNDLPVHYACLEYTTPLGERPAKNAICFWGDMQFGPHFLNLLKLSGFKISINFSSEPIKAPCRKDLAAQLEYSVKFLKEGTNHSERVNSVSSVYRLDH